jgi:hypothetical protein
MSFTGIETQGGKEQPTRYPADNVNECILACNQKRETSYHKLDELAESDGCMGAGQQLPKSWLTVRRATKIMTAW